jgi:colicin import membrane protein
MMTADSKESSVVVSLSELVRLEQQRAEAEAEARRAHDAARRRASAEIEGRARAAEEERLRATEAQRRAEALADREHEARLQATSEAEIVRARHQAEAAARAKALDATRQHEQRLAALREDGRRRGLAKMAYGTATLLAATWLAGAWYSVRTAHRMTEEQASYLQASTAQRGAFERLRRAFEEQSGEVTDLQRKLADLPRGDVAPATPAAPVTPGLRNPPPGRSPVALPLRRTTDARPACKKGDPICSDLP